MFDFDWVPIRRKNCDIQAVKVKQNVKVNGCHGLLKTALPGSWLVKENGIVEVFSDEDFKENFKIIVRPFNSIIDTKTKAIQN